MGVSFAFLAAVMKTIKFILIVLFLYALTLVPHLIVAYIAQGRNSTPSVLLNHTICWVSIGAIVGASLTLSRR